MPSIVPDYQTHEYETGRLLSLIATLNGLPSKHQKLVAEIILLRLFSLLENLICSVTLKLASGARYVDGSLPNLLAPRARSSLGAQHLLQTHGRTKSRNQLTWSRAREIKENVKYVLDNSDNLVTIVDRNGSLIDELRRVRNRIAHNNASARSKYRDVVRRYYGAYVNNVTPGMLLLTTRIQPSLLERYIRQERILAKNVVKA